MHRAARFLPGLLRPGQERFLATAACSQSVRDVVGMVAETQQLLSLQGPRSTAPTYPHTHIERERERERDATPLPPPPPPKKKNCLSHEISTIPKMSSMSKLPKIPKFCHFWNCENRPKTWFPKMLECLRVLEIWICLHSQNLSPNCLCSALLRGRGRQAVPPLRSSERPHPSF